MRQDDSEKFGQKPETSARGKRIKKLLAREWLYLNGWLFVGLLVLLGTAGIRGLAWRLERPIVRKHDEAMRNLMALAKRVYPILNLLPDFAPDPVSIPSGGLSADQFAALVKSYFQAYKAVPDQILTNRILAKYPFYGSLVEGHGMPQAKALAIQHTEARWKSRGLLSCVKLNADETPFSGASAANIDTSGAWEPQTEISVKGLAEPVTISTTEGAVWGMFCGLYDRFCVAPSRSRVVLYSTLDHVVRLDPWDYWPFFIFAPYFIFQFVRSLLFAARAR